jgi:transcriptional regulator with XRE-family HTH domain
MSEIARRVRAARAYAGLTLQEMANRVEIGRMTLIRIEREERPAKVIELNAIAEACGLPRGWFSVPFAWLDEAEIIRVDFSDVDVPWDAGEIRRRMVAEGLSGVLVTTQEHDAISDQLDLVGGRVLSEYQTEDGDLVVEIIRLRKIESRVGERLPPVPYRPTPQEADHDRRFAAIRKEVLQDPRSTPSVAERARNASQRLDGIPGASPGSRRAAGGQDRDR